MPFAYYSRLSRAEQAIYRRSAERTEVALSSIPELKSLLAPIEAALVADRRKDVERATQRFVAALVRDVGAPDVAVRVLATRPADEDGGELHGLYEIEEGKVPLLRVWMRTAAHKKPVAFRTFVRTVLHEVMHHLDFTILDLAPSFHTEGFFKRENSLARRLLGERPNVAGTARARAPSVIRPTPPEVPRPRQLSLLP